MSQSYVILTESSCDLTPELVAQAGAEVLPLNFTIEGKNYPHYPDGREMPIPEFYERMRGGAVAVTAAANVAELTDGMEVHLQRGLDVLFLCFSTSLSSTRDACAIAAGELQEKYPERKIYTVDTLAASAGQGLLVLLAGRKQKAGASIEEVRDFVEEAKLHMAHWFTVDDLTYLKRGGRISPTAAAVGAMLNIKPILHVDDEGAGAQSRSGGPGETAAGDGDPSGGPDDDDQPGLLPGGGGESAGERSGGVPSQGADDSGSGTHYRRSYRAGTDGAVFPGGAPVKKNGTAFPAGSAVLF